MRIFTPLLLLLALATASTAAPPPNLLLIYSDDHGYFDASCFGGDIPTPHIDSLATAGARLTDFYAQPVCTPSRFALLTGRYPNRSHDRMLAALMRAGANDAHKGIRPDETTLAQLLQSRGYRTAIFGKWHLGHGDPAFLPTRHGFDSFTGFTGGCTDFFTLHYGNIPDWYRNESLSDDRGYVTDVIADEAVKFLAAQSADRPFFLYLPFNAPHYAAAADPADNDKRKPTMQAKPQTIARFAHIPDETRRIYSADVAELDEAVGRVLKALDDAHLAANTFVIFASDNGGDTRYGARNTPLRGNKNELYEGGVRVPCVMRFPGHITPGSVIHQPACVLDILPTFAHLAGIDTSHLQLDGVDLAPALFRGQPIQRDIFFRHGKASDSLRRGDFKYLRIGPRKFLYNLHDDISEEHDLAATNPTKLTELESAHAAIAKTLP